MNRYKITAALMAVAMLAGMTACGNTAEEALSETAESETIAEETTTATEEETSVEEETIAEEDVIAEEITTLAETEMETFDDEIEYAEETTVAEEIPVFDVTTIAKPSVSDYDSYSDYMDAYEEYMESYNAYIAEYDEYIEEYFGDADEPVGEQLVFKYNEYDVLPAEDRGFNAPEGFNEADYTDRFYEWKFDESIVIESKEKLIESGLSAEAFSAAEKYILGCEEYSETVETMSTAALNDEGLYEYGNNTIRIDAELIDENGNPVIVFNKGAYDDFDGDGKKEAFIMFTTPYFGFSNKINFTFFADSEGKVSFVSYGYDGILTPIRYNGFMHMGVSYGVNISTSHSEIFAVENGKAVKKHENQFIGSKRGILIEETAAQAPGCWYVFWDNKLKEYFEVAMEDIDNEFVAEIYNSEAFKIVESEYNTEFSEEEFKNTAKFYGGKYIVIEPWRLAFEFDGKCIYYAPESILCYNEEKAAEINIDAAEYYAVKLDS